LSSTTNGPNSERGQILVLFAGGFILICLIAALVFDVGQNLLDRRSEQNAADAAALAGARYVPGATYTYHGLCSALPADVLAEPSTKPAVKAACEVAAENGYVDGTNGRTVQVDMPPIAPSSFSGLPFHIQVRIGSTRPSFFQGVLGVTQQVTGANAVATNDSDIPLPYSLLALDPTGCATNKINGSPGTVVTTNGTVHIDSNCSVADGGALLLSGNGVLSAPECDAVGGIKTQGGAVNNCIEAPTGVLVSGDPLKNLPPPPQPGAPAAIQPLDGGPIPAGCPGNSAATDASPATCAFTSGTVSGKHYRLFPGNYPGGLSTSKSTLYLSPGIYWFGGGGLHIQSDGAVVSKAAGDDTGLAPSGGILIYNTTDPDPVVSATCASGGPSAGCYGPIQINGGGGSTPTLALTPIESGQYKNMVIFVDRTAATATGFDIDLNGEDANLSVTGTIYAPSGSVKFNGSDTDTFSAQVICYNFQVNGSGSSFTIDYDPDKLFHLKGVGLVE
jgi:hypothetical protein